MGSLSVTADPHHRDPFGPLRTVDLRDAERRCRHGHRNYSGDGGRGAEPIQGEGGVAVRYAGVCPRRARRRCDRTRTLLIRDEVQSGLGRTGVGFAFQELGLRPSLVAIGKALGAGIPIGAALVSEDVASRLSPGDHGSTYGGNLLACRAGLFFVDQLLSGGLLAHVTRVGHHLGRQLSALAGKHAIVREVRGRELDLGWTSIVLQQRSSTRRGRVASW